MGTSIVLSILVLALVGASQGQNYHQETIVHPGGTRDILIQKTHQPIDKFSSFRTSQNTPSYTNSLHSDLGTRGFSTHSNIHGGVSSTDYRQTSPVFGSQNVHRNNAVGVRQNTRFNNLHTNNNILGVNRNQRFNTLRTHNNVHGVNHNQRFNTLRNNNNVHGLNRNQRFNTLSKNGFQSTNFLNEGHLVSGNQYLGSDVALEDPNLISHRSESDGHGGYSFAYKTADGVTRQEEGTPVGYGSVAVRGSYSYTSPEGVDVVVNYIADENGFQVDSPNVPAIPEHSLRQIERAEEARRLGIDISNAGNEGSYSNFQTLNGRDSNLLNGNSGLIRPLNLRTSNFGNHAGVGLDRNINTITTSSNGFSGNNRIIGNAGRFNNINDHRSGLGLTRNFNTVGTLRTGIIGNNHIGSTSRHVSHIDTSAGINSRFSDQINGLEGEHYGVRSGSSFARRPSSFSSRLRHIRQSDGEDVNDEENKEENSKVEQENKDAETFHNKEFEST